MVWKTADKKIVGVMTLAPPPTVPPQCTSKTVCTESGGRTRCVTTIECGAVATTKPTETKKTSPRIRRTARYSPRVRR